MKIPSTGVRPHRRAVRLPGPAGVLVLILSTSGTADCGAVDDVWESGFWKSPPVPVRAEAEFGREDPYGLSVGVRIRTDCSIFWIDQSTNKLYCFNSLTSKSFFIDNPSKYIREAEAFLTRSR